MKAVVSHSDVALEDVAYSALGKGLNYAVVPASLPIEDFLSGVEKAVFALPQEASKEVRQETVRIRKASRKIKDNLSGTGRRALRTLQADAVLTNLPPGKGNAAVVFNTSDYNRKFAALSLIGCCLRTPLRPSNGGPLSFSSSHRFPSGSHNNCGHMVRGILDCTGS
jgi:hypothetical protein